MRETVESIVVAFVLAFLFRTFEAEAFVIPTGSMAPTLLGRHKDVTCEKCGLYFEVGASDELDDAGLLKPSFRVNRARCPNCRYENDVLNEPVFKGDRILVNKFPYEFHSPDRWDVVVFKYPEGPTTNYIKRLVGLPGEQLKVFQGDVYIKDRETNAISILRKDDPRKQRVLQLLVYDANHPERELLDAGWPRRWSGVRRAEAGDDRDVWIEDESLWQFDRDANAFILGSGESAPQWLRYRHYVPKPQDWDALEKDEDFAVPEPQLILDYCSYNAYTHRDPASERYDFGTHWVGDLTINFTATISDVGDNGQLLLELVEGPRWYRCRIDVQTGAVELFYIDRLLSRDVEPGEVEEDAERQIATGTTNVRGPGTYEISFANVDNRLCLWINDELVEFENGGAYSAPAINSPSEDDRAPVGIAARNLALRVSNLLLQRDIYYRSELADPSYSQYRDPQAFEDDSELMSDQGWFELDDDEFLVLGDNSPRSKDSRLWGNTRLAKHRHAVPRAALIGKAFFIYWPHGIPFLNDGDGYAVAYHHNGRNETDYPSFRIPFYPQVWRMHRIR